MPTVRGVIVLERSCCGDPSKKKDKREIERNGEEWGEIELCQHPGF
jgi:hypothetical protein